MEGEVTPQSLEQAVCSVLGALGPEVLLDSRTFLSALMDYVDMESPELQMLRRNLDDVILAPVAALERSEEILDSAKLSNAIRQSAELLASERMVDARVALSTMRQVSNGIRQYLGMPKEPAREDGAKQPRQTATARSLSKGHLFAGEGSGSFDYTLLARPSRFGTMSAPHRLKSEEVSVSKGLLKVKVTNTSKETVHLLNAQAYAVQSGAESSGGWAYACGYDYTEVLAPGESTVVTFGDKDFEGDWPNFSKRYYFDGYASEA